MGTQKLLQGDCLEKMKQMEDNSVDVIVTDPPYGILGGLKTIGGSNMSKVNEYNCEWDNSRMSKEILTEIFRVSKNQIIFGYNYLADMLPVTNGLIVWDKKKKNNWFDNFSDGEMIWTSFKKPLRIFRFLWMGAIREGKRTKKVHPTQKPVDLMEWIIKNYTTEGDIIMDAFMGSGTTGVACKNLNRDFIGIELDKTYFDIATKRINDALHENDGVKTQ